MEDGAQGTPQILHTLRVSYLIVSPVKTWKDVKLSRVYYRKVPKCRGTDRPGLPGGSGAADREALDVEALKAREVGTLVSAISHPLAYDSLTHCPSLTVQTELSAPSRA